MKLLVVDDDPKIRSLLEEGLRESGMSCDVVGDAETALERVRAAGTGGYDLLLLDIMLPGRSGWDVVEELRSSGDQVPVIFLTARHSVSERVRGLELGADDYVIKPFELTELLARIRAVVRRREAMPTQRVGRMTLDPSRRTVELEDRRIDLSPREFDVLRTLVEAKGEPLSRRELLRTVWGLDFDPGTNVVEVQIAHLRRKLRAFGLECIATEPGRGYRIDGAGLR